ncbi:MAG: ComEC family competence protein [Bacteroidales bacterium]|nr:ComEC family competence protein [Bacteroidales bacterium]
MNYWRKLPFVRILIPFMLGIIAAIFFEKEIHIPFIMFAGLFVVIFSSVFFLEKFISFNFRWIYGFVINILFFVIGFELTIQNTEKFFENKNLPALSYEQNIKCEVLEPASETERSYKVLARMLYITDDSIVLQKSPKCLFYFQKDSLSSKIAYGDRLILKTYINIIKPPQNPGEFDYKSYLYRKGVYYQGFVKANNWEICEKNQGNPLFKFSYKLRGLFLSILRKNKIEGNEYAIASAILLGYDDKLDPELRSEFTGAGAMHILCVSGLHVGIVCLFLTILLGFLRKNKFGRILYFVILILSLWLYALITGLSPSVMRAATMLSFVIAGKAIKRHSDIYNSLAVSAFVLLLINPFIITEVGFQLSYAAVLGIVALQPPMYRLFVFSNWFADKTWAIITVSIAAQLGTFPIAIFYFHQFPDYFIITNLIVIPLSFAIISTGFLVLITSPINFISYFVSKILISLLWFLNTSVRIIDSLPFSKLTDISLNIPEVIMFYALIICFAIFLLKTKKKHLYFGLVVLIFLMFSFSLKSIQNYSNKKFIVYNVNKSSAFDFISGKTSYFFADSILMNDSKTLSYRIKNNHCNLGINNIKNHSLHLSINDYCYDNLIFKNRNYFQFFDKTIVLIDKRPAFKNEDLKKLKLNYLIITENPYLKIDELTKLYEFDLLIFDSSNSFYSIRKWKKECIKNNISYYSVPESGAFVVDI